MPRADLTLRPELQHLLGILNISASDLLFTDDPDITSLQPSTTKFMLVDHNRPVPSLRGFPVSGIIDHHEDEGGDPSASPRIIEKSGSCTSLVTNYFRSSFPSKSAPGGLVSVELGKLGLAAILVDTICMKDKNKVTPHDSAATSFLEQKVVEEEPGWDRTKFFHEMWDAKHDVDDLPLRDHLRKDWKEWADPHRGGGERKVGIAAVLRDFTWFSQRDKDAFLTAVKNWAIERDLDVVSVMTTAGEGSEFKRELMVWAIKERAKDSIKAFEDNAAKDLQLSQWGSGELDSEDGERKVWNQRNLAASRKEVAPLLRTSVGGRDSEAQSKF